MLYSCTRMATVDVKGLIDSKAYKATYVVKCNEWPG